MDDSGLEGKIDSTNISIHKQLKSKQIKEDVTFSYRRITINALSSSGIKLGSTMVLA